ncbi:MAG TPA: hypothetical protein ENJ31_02625 [Anaerolineae bacterium]|nr:hypothetical protein [Anaerolineae bacterium]
MGWTVDPQSTKRVLDLLDKPKPPELVYTLGESFVERLRRRFPNRVVEVQREDAYGQGDIAYRVRVRGQADDIEDFLADEELKIGLEHGVTVLTFVSDGVSDAPEAQERG